MQIHSPWSFFQIVISVLLLCSSSKLAADVGITNAVPKGNSFTFRIRGEPETLDWTLAHTDIEAEILMNLMEGLVSFDVNSRVIPALAQTWSMDPSGHIYTFKLRPNVKWTDGELLTANDFVYSWKRLLSPVTAAPYAYLLFDVEGAEDFHQGKLRDFNKVGIKALDKLTLEVTLSHPVAHWINIPAFWSTFPLRESVVEGPSMGWLAPGRMVTLGPYRLVLHDFDAKIGLRSNPDYYGIPGNVDEVNALIVKDDAEALRMYESGKLDLLTELGLGELKRVSGRADLKIYPQLKTVLLGFSTDKYPMSVLKVRRAIAMAIDKSAIPRLLFGGQKPATSFVPQGMLGYSPNLGLPYDPMKAKAELRSSGVEFNGAMTLNYLLPNWDRSMVVAEYVQSQIRKNLGIEISLNPLDTKSYRMNLDLHSSVLFDLAWTADYPDPDSFMSMYLSTSGNSRTAWKNDRYDQSVLAAREQRLGDREKTYIALQKFLLEDQAVLVPLFYEPNVALVKPRVKNMELNSLGYLYLRRLNVGN